MILKRLKIMKDNSEAYQFESFIIHIHGGGFVSMSSNSHQSYTRMYKNKILLK